MKSDGCRNCQYRKICVLKHMLSNRKSDIIYICKWWNIEKLFKRSVEAAERHVTLGGKLGDG